MHGHVAGGIDADDHGVVDLAVGHAALHGLAAGLHDVEVAQGVAVGRDDHAGAAALPVGGKDGQHAVLRLVHRGDSLRLGLEHGGRGFRPNERIAGHIGNYGSQAKDPDSQSGCRFHLLSLALHKSR